MLAVVDLRQPVGKQTPQDCSPFLFSLIFSMCLSRYLALTKICCNVRPFFFLADYLHNSCLDAVNTLLSILSGVQAWGVTKYM